MQSIMDTSHSRFPIICCTIDFVLDNDKCRLFSTRSEDFCNGQRNQQLLGQPFCNINPNYEIKNCHIHRLFSHNCLIEYQQITRLHLQTNLLKSNNVYCSKCVRLRFRKPLFFFSFLCMNSTWTKKIILRIISSNLVLVKFNRRVPRKQCQQV